MELAKCPNDILICEYGEAQNFLMFSKFQQFDGRDAGESPNCATDGAWRAVAFLHITDTQIILEVLSLGILNKKEYHSCILSTVLFKNPF